MHKPCAAYGAEGPGFQVWRVPQQAEQVCSRHVRVLLHFREHSLCCLTLLVLGRQHLRYHGRKCAWVTKDRLCHRRCHAPGASPVLMHILEVHCSAPKLCHTSGCIITIHVYMHALMLCLLSAINALDAEQHSFHLPRAAPVTSDARAAHSACMAGGGHSEQSGAIF